MTMYNKEDCLNSVKKSIEEKEALIRALENVKRVRTKSGADFKILSKNFENCEISTLQYALQPNERELTVFYKAGGNYLTHSIYLYRHFDDMKPEEIKHEPEPKQSMLKQIYAYDVDEIEEAIQKDIANQRKFLEREKNNLTVIELNFDKIQEAANLFRNEIYELCKGCQELKDFANANIRL